MPGGEAHDAEGKQEPEAESHAGHEWRRLTKSRLEVYGLDGGGRVPVSLAGGGGRMPVSKGRPTPSVLRPAPFPTILPGRK